MAECPNLAPSCLLAIGSFRRYSGLSHVSLQNWPVLTHSGPEQLQYSGFEPCRGHYTKVPRLCDILEVARTSRIAERHDQAGPLVEADREPGATKREDERMQHFGWIGSRADERVRVTNLDLKTQLW
jgi:hypothetical protein